jgi:hypothetical protein
MWNPLQLSLLFPGLRDLVGLLAQQDRREIKALRALVARLVQMEHKEIRGLKAIPEAWGPPGHKETRAHQGRRHGFTMRRNSL